MYDPIGLRDWLIKQVYSFTGIVHVPSGTAPRPSKPFISYSIIVPFIPDTFPPEVRYTDIVREELNWSRKTRFENPSVVWSFTSVSDDIEECYENILNLRRWFALDGKGKLKEKGIIVARLEPVNDRSLILDETEAEYRAGFDTVLRIISEISMDIETIERVEINEKLY